MTACRNCHGLECTNVQINDVEQLDEDYDSEPEPVTSELCLDDYGQLFIADEYDLSVQYEEEV